MHSSNKVWLAAVVLLSSFPLIASAGERSVTIDLGFTPVQLADGTVFLGPGPAPSEWKINLPANINAADTTNADQLWSGGGLGLNLNGAGVSVGVWDGGPVLATHPEFNGRVTVVDSGTAADHATHVAGTIGATGYTPALHGMANAVQIYSYNWTNDTAEMAAAVANYGIVLSNHSYSSISGWDRGITWSGISGTVDTWFGDRSVYSVEDPSFGKYNSGTQALDNTLCNNPKLLSVWAASNDRTDQFTNAQGDQSYVTYLSAGGEGAGYYLVSTSSYSAPPRDGNGGTGYDSLPPDQVAKNTLTVGAINDITVDPYTSGNVTMTSFSSWGPTDDGRVKPDVVANGSSLNSPVAYVDNEGNYYYGSMSGTSMAAPNATGTCALLVQHYKNLNGGVVPNSATIKALVIHTATDAGNPGPDYSYGYGVLNGAAAAQLLTDVGAPDSTVFLSEDTFNGTELTYSIFSDGGDPLKFTLVWTDPAPTIMPGLGLDDSTSVLVNDLDLWITDAQGTVYYPWTLDPANPGFAAVQNQFNHRDNVEQVLLSMATAGWYTLHVGGGLNAGYSSQDFSLIGSGLAVPEPGTLAMLACFAAVWFVWRRRR